jgi:RNA polymerase sigma factor (sigma-70 family)
MGRYNHTNREMIFRCYRSFAAPLRAFLRRRTRSVHDAEDLTQEVFLRMCRMEGEGEIRHLKGLVYKMANNLLKDRSRRSYTRVMRNAVSADSLEFEDCASEPSGEIEVAQMIAALFTTLGNLRPTARTAFLMYRIEGCSQAEVAAALGISASMVEKHVSYTMTALREAGIASHG